ncbi:MAG: hypothetical protein P4K93_07480 [Terracidiphilus sp.]|nr:hypothetical protein [Terracidiphilus sp.]
MGIWQKISGWFEGKKTILGGVVILAAAVAGVWYGKLDPVTAVTLAGAGLSVIGWGDKANRHQAELLTALQGVATVGADVRAGNTQQAVRDAENTAGALAPLAIGEAVTWNGVNLHLSASTATELSQVLSSLVPPVSAANSTGAASK